ncbi:MAG: hypothetical protein AAB463_00865 [Patescibacteria group bacterium]|mgnify:CR=1 FL=1
MYSSAPSLRSSWLLLAILCALLWGISFLIPLTYPIIYSSLASVILFGGVGWTGRVLVTAWVCEVLFGTLFGTYILPTLCMVALYAVFRSIVVIHPIEDVRAPSFSQIGIALIGAYVLALAGWSIDAVVVHSLSGEALRAWMPLWARWSWMLASAFISVSLWLLGVALARARRLG